MNIQQIYSDIEKALAQDKLKFAGEKTACSHIYQLAGDIPYYSLVIDYEHFSIKYINDKLRDSIGLSAQKDLSTELLIQSIHADSIHVLQKVIQYYKLRKNDCSVFSYALKVKFKHTWEWVYVSFKPVYHSENGNVKCLLAIASNIDHVLTGHFQSGVSVNVSSTVYDDVKLKYRQLTDREKLVLQYISEEYPSTQIAKILSISPSTVDTHRRNLIKKLDVQSSSGLVKYAVYFSLLLQNIV